MPTPLSTITPVPAYGPIPAAAPSEPQTPAVPSSPAAPVAAAVRVSRGAGHNTFGVPERVRRSVEDLHRRVDALESLRADVSGLGKVVDRLINAVTPPESDDPAEDTVDFLQYYPDGSVTDASQITQGLEFEDFDDGTLTCLCSAFNQTSNAELAGRVVIPYETEHDGKTYSVVGVAQGADRWGANDVLEEVIAPVTVRTVGQFAFRQAGVLRTVVLPGPVVTIEEGAFSGLYHRVLIVRSRNTSLNFNGYQDYDNIDTGYLTGTPGQYEDISSSGNCGGTDYCT